MNVPIAKFRQQVMEMNDEDLELLRDCWDARSFKPDKDTEHRQDTWLILAIRILNHMEREDVADGIDTEYAALEQQLSIYAANLRKINKDLCS